METYMNVFDKYPSYKQSTWSQENIERNRPYLAIVVLFVLVVTIFEYYIDSRQLYSYIHAKQVPRLLKDHIPQEKFDRSIQYNIHKSIYGYIEGSIFFIEGIVLLLIGYLPFMWDLSKKLCYRYGIINETSSALAIEIISTLVFVLLLTLKDTTVRIPFSLYFTFVVEKEFNKTTLTRFATDKLLELGLFMLIGGPILSAMIWIIRSCGDNFFYYVWMFQFVVSLVMMDIYPEYIAPLFNKYTQLQKDDEKYGDLYADVEKLANKVSFPLKKLFIVDGSTRSSHSNAYFYGWFNNKRIVLYDTLLTQVTRNELLAILGHEIGHWSLGHTVQGFVIAQVYFFLLFLSFSFVQNTAGLYAAFGFAFLPNKNPIFIGLTLFLTVFMSPVDKVLNFILFSNSRYNEFMADRYAQIKFNYGKELQSGLIKISIENLGNLAPDWLYSLYHHSHPTLVERLTALDHEDKKSD